MGQSTRGERRGRRASFGGTQQIRLPDKLKKERYPEEKLRRGNQRGTQGITARIQTVRNQYSTNRFLPDRRKKSSLRSFETLHLCVPCFKLACQSSADKFKA